jgi:hypothetical protein
VNGDTPSNSAAVFSSTRSSGLTHFLLSTHQRRQATIRASTASERDNGMGWPQCGQSCRSVMDATMRIREGDVVGTNPALLHTPRVRPMQVDA